MARFLLLVLSSFATSAVYVIDAANATSSPPLSSPMQPEDPPNGVFYQDFHGYLCLDGTCHDGSNQDNLIREQLFRRHACRDVREDLCQTIQNPDVECQDNEGGGGKRLQAYCPMTCRTCHDRTRTRPVLEEYDVEEGGPSEDVDPGRSSGASPPDVDHSARQEERRRRRRRPYTSSPSKTRGEIRASLRHAAGSDLGVPQLLSGVDGVAPSQVEEVIEQARVYVQYTVMVDDLYWTVRDKCRNRHELCAAYAVQGRCETYDDIDDPQNSNNETMALWMQNACAPVCHTCEQLHYLARCPVDYNQKHAWYPSDLNNMFERIANDPDYQLYHNVTVLSRPASRSPKGDESEDVPDGPWVIVLENFTTPEEARRLIELGGVLGYERSEDVGDEDESGEVGSVVSVGRTSTNAWCELDKCENDPLVVPVIERMEKLTGISRVYAEHLQLLRYEVGQFYEEHHDYVEIDRMRYGGVRILTVFLYLNDVEEGGETSFPHVVGVGGGNGDKPGLSVKPKLGRVVLWPSVLDDEPHLKDDRTNHQAMPVIKGNKYGANAWFHQRHIRTGFDIEC